MVTLNMLLQVGSSLLFGTVQKLFANPSFWEGGKKPYVGYSASRGVKSLARGISQSLPIKTPDISPINRLVNYMLFFSDYVFSDYEFVSSEIHTKYHARF